MSPPTDVEGIEVLSESLVGREGGFLAIRRFRLVNRRADGSRSRPYLCDFLARPMGVDAVVVAVFTREPRPRVLVRQGLRPPLHLGRDPAKLPLPDPAAYLFFREVVAGILEPGDEGEEGVRRRAAIEVREEAGYDVAAEEVILLGRGTFPSPGSMAERFHLAAVEVDPRATARCPEGDGSPMEEGATVEWWDLDEAIAACVEGRIEDLKSEVTFRRLAERLASAPSRS